MPGLMLDAMNGTSKPKNPFEAAQDPNQPAQWTVDPAKESVAGQLSGFMSFGSPLLTQARTGAAQEANRRGLYNTSIAVGAGEEAALRVALPVAQSDASIYGTAARENVAAKNTFGLTRLQGQETRQTQAQAGEIETGLIGRRGEQERLNIGTSGEQQRLGIAEQGTQQRLTQAQAGDIQSRMAELQAALQTGLIGTEGAQTRLTQAQAQAAQQELSRLEAQLQTGLIGAQGEQQRLTQEQAGQIQTRMAELQAQLQTGLIGAEGQQTRMTAAQQAAAQKELTSLQAQLESALFTRQAAQQTAMQELQGQQGVTLQNLQTAAAKDLANIEANYKSLMQTSASATQVMAMAQQGINDILKDTTLSNPAKTALITKLQDGLKAQMGVIGAIGDLDLSGLLTFPETGIGTAAPAAGGTTTPTTPTGFIGAAQRGPQQPIRR